MIIVMNEKSWTKIRNKEKKQKSEKKSEIKLKKLTPLAAIILMTLILFVIVRKSEEPLSVKTILRYTPENMILAACVLILFFALNVTWQQSNNSSNKAYKKSIFILISCQLLNLGISSPNILYNILTAVSSDPIRNRNGCRQSNHTYHHSYKWCKQNSTAQI